MPRRGPATPREGAPAGAGARLSTFIFHRVLAQPDPLLPEEPHAASFDELLGWIGSQFQVLPPLQACERLAAGTLPGAKVLKEQYESAGFDSFIVQNMFLGFARERLLPQAA